jgi:hypothetical protein
VGQSEMKQMQWLYMSRAPLESMKSSSVDFKASCRYHTLPSRPSPLLKSTRPIAQPISLPSTIQVASDMPAKNNGVDDDASDILAKNDDKVDVGELPSGRQK